MFSYRSSLAVYWLWKAGNCLLYFNVLNDKLLACDCGGIEVADTELELGLPFNALAK
jgi:hypothetical protein